VPPHLWAFRIYYLLHIVILCILHSKHFFSPIMCRYLARHRTFNSKQNRHGLWPGELLSLPPQLSIVED
jgi:hypothetical protein